MVSRDAVLEVLRTIDDPEMPINIVDLGLIGDVRIEESLVAIDLLPTFVGCHALPFIEEQIRKRVAGLEGAKRVEVRTRFDPPWTVDRITRAGRETLRKVGITVPEGMDVPIRCPVCGSTNVQQESAFGPTRCKMIYHCETCRSPFEHLKQVGVANSLLQIGIPASHGKSL